MVGVVLRDVTKRFGDVVALDHLDLAIEPGELFGLVGASGCGKTTALRIVAGLEQPTAGAVLLGGLDVTAVPARARDVGIVPQGDTLLSKRTGRRNIRFPLEVRARAVPPEEVDARVTDQARELDIERLLDRRPAQLSRGERRAVQLARALVARPGVVLLDEPFSFMDHDLRRRMRTDVRRIQRRHDVTTLLVTADQEDATVVCDRVAVLVDGGLHQIAAPADLLDRPATTAVAAFFGEPAMNLVEVLVQADAEGRIAALLGHDVRVWSPLLAPYVGRRVTVGLRPADLAPGEPGRGTVAAVVERVAPHGHRTDVWVRTPTGEDLAVTTPAPGPRPGDRIDLALRPERLHWFDPTTGMALLHPSG